MFGMPWGGVPGRPKPAPPPPPGYYSGAALLANPQEPRFLRFRGIRLNPKGSTLDPPGSKRLLEPPIPIISESGFQGTPPNLGSWTDPKEAPPTHTFPNPETQGYPKLATTSWDWGPSMKGGWTECTRRKPYAQGWNPSQR